jgi:hypothetical protein
LLWLFVDIEYIGPKLVIKKNAFASRLKTSGKYLMEDLHAVGGVQMKYLLK